MPADPHALLAKALRSLSDEEQGLVLRLLPLAGPGAATTPVARAAAREAVAAALVAERSTDDKVGFLLRLPASTHAELKQWADEHGHSMNVVVRGLVERFLDEQRGGR